MKKNQLSFLFVIMFIMLTSSILSIPIGEVIVIDIPWVLDASDDGSVLVGGAEGGGGSYWTEETGVVIISATCDASAISENGIIVGKEINEDDLFTACWWDINILEPNFLGAAPGAEPDETNSANAVSDDASTIVGLHWYSQGMGSAKAYKWTPATGTVLLPEVMNWSDSRADCVTADGSLIGGYAAEERSIWRPVLWNDSELIELPYTIDGWSTVSSLSQTGEWCSGYNGNKGAIWQNQELVTLEGPDPEFIHTHFRTITEDGWAGGESANWNTMVSVPILWNPEDSLMNAIDFFNSLDVEIPDDFNIVRIRRISNDHLIFVGNGYNTTTYWNYGFIVKIPGPHSVSNFSAELEEYNNVHLTWNFDINTPGAQNIFINKDGEEIAQLDPSVTEYFDNDLDEGTYQYEIYVTYDEYDNSVSRSVDIEINLHAPSDLTVEVNVFDVELNWNPPAEQRSLTSYNVYRNDQVIASVTESMYSDIIPEPGDYNYYVTAIYSDQYESDQSNCQDVNIDISQYIPLNFTGEVDIEYDVQLTWDEPVNNDALTGYNIYRNDELIDTVSETIYTDADLADGTYTYFITSVFLEEFESDPTETLSFEIQQSGGSDDSLIPVETSLSIYPNPFNPQTNIQYCLSENSEVKITIYNIKGEKIYDLLNERKTSGTYNIIWNGIDNSGKQVTSGMYFIKLLTEHEIKTKKVIMLK